MIRPCKVNYLFLIRLFLEYWDGGRHFIFIFYRIYVIELQVAGSYILQYMKIIILLCVK